MDSCTESAEAACDILSQLVNCTIKTLGLISTARPSFMDVSQVIESHCPVYQRHIIPTNLVTSLTTKFLTLHSQLVKMKCSKLFWFTEHPLPYSSGPLCVCADSGVCQLQVPVLHQDWRYASWRPVPEGSGCQQQWHPEAAEDEQLSSRLPSRSPKEFCYPAFISWYTVDQRLEGRGWVI